MSEDKEPIAKFTDKEAVKKIIDKLKTSNPEELKRLQGLANTLTALEAALRDTDANHHQIASATVRRIVDAMAPGHSSGADISSVAEIADILDGYRNQTTPKLDSAE